MNKIFSDKFILELQKENPDYNLIKEQILLAYNQDTSSNLPLNIGKTDSRLKAVVGWLNKKVIGFDLHFYVRKEILKQNYSSCLSSKIGSLSQFHCPFCNGRALVTNIIVRIS